MKTTGIIVITAMLLTLSTSAFTLQEPEMPMDTFGITNTWGIGLSAFNFTPKEDQFNSASTLLGGSLRYFTSNILSIELTTGQWSKEWTTNTATAVPGKAKITPTTFGVNWYPWQTLGEASEGGGSLSMFFLGAGLASYSFDWKVSTSVNIVSPDDDNYKATHTGFYLCAGYEHFFSEHFSGNLQIRSHHANIKNARPAGYDDRDVDLSNITFGASLIWTFR